MTSWCFKLVMGLCAALLVGCATPLPTSSVALPTNPAPVQGATHGPIPEAQQTPVAQVAPEVSDTAALMPEEAPAPLLADAVWKQRGVASWYGIKFNGRRTASGERFRASGLTAAHRTLPIHSYVRVRRVANGEVVVVRINDRGPFHSNRVLDLSYAAAQKLGFVALGSAEVEIEHLPKEN